MKLTSAQVGYAAEGFVIYKLSLWGYDVSTAPPGCSYDLLCDTGEELYKVQVKGANRFSYNGRGKSPSFKFNNKRGRGKRYTYDERDYDILACVALPLQRCLFNKQDITKGCYSKQPALFTRDGEEDTWRETLKRLRESKPDV